VGADCFTAAWNTRELRTSRLFASHIPIVLEDDGSQFGVLKGHITRSNMQWRDFVPTVDALAIFAGVLAHFLFHRSTSNAGACKMYWQTHESNTTAMRLYDKVAQKSGLSCIASSNDVYPSRSLRIECAAVPERLEN
jgi:Putative FMN-binding domain